MIRSRSAEDCTTNRPGWRLLSSWSVAVVSVLGAVTLMPVGVANGAATQQANAVGVVSTAHTETVGEPGCSASGVGSPSASVGYWMTGADGGVYSCGDAPWFGSLTSLHITPNGPVVGIATCGSGYWLTTSAGAVYAFGSAQFYGGADHLQLRSPIVGIAASPDCWGYWLVAADGGVFTYGDAYFLGSAGNIQLRQPLVGMAVVPEPLQLCRPPVSEACAFGYWLVASDGGLFSYSSSSEDANGWPANFLGSTGCFQLNRPIVGMTVSPDMTTVGTNTACHSGPLPAGGYWMVAADGGIFSFGNAPFLGSTGCIALDKPVVGMVASPDTTTVGTNTTCHSGSLPAGGYWMVASDGGIFSFGNAQYTGSLPGSGISVQNIVGMGLYEPPQGPPI